MLYDILFIDDDFGNILQGQEINDDTTRENAPKIYDAYLTRGVFSNLTSIDNLKVTYTTGESADLERLKAKDLSCIQYIFCDLHLSGFDERHSYKEINAKIIGILRKINSKIKSAKVTIYLHSQYTQKSYYGEHGISDLEKKLAKEFPEKYPIEIINKKNQLSEKKEPLIRNNLKIYARQLIINKAIELETVFDEKLSLSKSARESPSLNFQDKFLVFQSQYSLEALQKNQIQLLQQIRNKLAHTDNKLDEIKGGGEKKLFWKICSGTEQNKPIEFHDFDQLMKYIESIDQLIEHLEQAPRPHS